MFDKKTVVEKLKSGIYNITFTKLNGSERVMSCTLNESIIPAATTKDPLTQKKFREMNDNLVVVYSIDKLAFRSFRLSNLIKMEKVNV